MDEFQQKVIKMLEEIVRLQKEQNNKMEDLKNIFIKYDTDYAASMEREHPLR